MTPEKLAKINADSYYKPLYELFGLEYIIDAGFIFDNSPTIEPINDYLNCTPISFMLDKFKAAKNPAIILSTGSFCPLHDGHLEMMVKAKEAVEAAGYDVIGGYLAPDNDDYVLTKTNVLNIHERISIINSQIKNIDWLAVDPWSGVFRKYAENFTSLIEHLEMYVEKHLKRKIPIFYVCGGDNARFMKTFHFKGHCVVVERPGNDLGLLRPYFDNTRRLLIYNNNKNSSTEVRKTFIKKENKRKRLLLRVDEYDERQDKVIALLSKYFDEVIVSNFEKEKKIFTSIGLPFISIDSLLIGKQNISVSRQYDYFGAKLLGRTNRPGTLSLDQQLDNIPTDEEYLLFDDDIHTGGTINFVKEKLSERNIKTSGVMSLTLSTEFEEILDVRDFYFNKENSGLVILNSENQTERFPYMYPFVCPYERASIENPMEFSLALWDINYDYAYKKNKWVDSEACVFYRNELKKAYEKKNV